ncbi:MAG TPA: GDSL-type esterase/lipase family protein [Planctomycetota bacterium]|jgi:lysophospholipase L1-like esterase
MSEFPRNICLLASLFSVLAVMAGEGPTPYPDPKNEAAWPGRGPIRAFPFMVGERVAIWKQREKNQGAIAFVGDSLIGGWRDLAKAFPSLKVANCGVGGDVSRGVLFRFREDVLGLKPRAVVVNVGFNDLTAHGNPADCAQNIAAVLEQAWAQNPEMPIVVCNVPPRDAPQAPMQPGAREDLNARLAKLGEGKQHLLVLDMTPTFTGPDGKPKAELFAKDHVHLAEAGYKAWADVLRPALEKLGLKAGDQ